MAKKPIRATFAPEIVLENWVELLKALPVMREAECKAALDAELVRKEPRKDFILRLHRRFHRLRGEREFRAIMKPLRKQPARTEP